MVCSGSSLLKSARPLVVLLHGFMGGRIQLVPLATMLSRDYDVINYGYASRKDNLCGHASALIDTVHRRQEETQQTTHFITHSFGGVVLHRAFNQGLCEALGNTSNSTRCVLIAPPLKGAAFARAFQRENLRGPDMMKDALHATAKMILGERCGMELMMNDENWFQKQIGVIPRKIETLVVFGNVGRVNILLGENSDGVVGVSETWMNRPHYRLEVARTHNLLLYTPSVVSLIERFISGEVVGELVNGEQGLRA